MRGGRGGRVSRSCGNLKAGAGREGERRGGAGSDSPLDRRRWGGVTAGVAIVKVRVNCQAQQTDPRVRCQVACWILESRLESAAASW